MRNSRDQPANDFSGSFSDENNRTEGKEAELKVQASELKYRMMAEQLSLLQEIHQAILSSVRLPPEIAITALSHLRQLVNCQMSSLVLFDFEKGILSVLAADGDSGLQKSDATFPLEDFPFDISFADSEYFLISDQMPLPDMQPGHWSLNGF